MTGLRGKNLGWLIDLLGGESDKRDRTIATLERALAGCEHFALRIVNNPLGHSFDRDNAAGIVEIARYAGCVPQAPVEPTGHELTPHPGTQSGAA